MKNHYRFLLAMMFGGSALAAVPAVCYQGLPQLTCSPRDIRQPSYFVRVLSLFGENRTVVCLYPQHGYVVTTTPSAALEARGDVTPGERTSLRLENRAGDSVGNLDADPNSHRGHLAYRGVTYDLSCKTGD